MLIGCVVMASGEGRRFSDVPGAKLLAPVAGTPLVERTVRSVPQGVMVGGAGGLLPGFDVVVATRWPAVAELACALGVGCMLHGGSERSASVRAGLEFGAMRWDGCLFVPGDQALVRPKTYARLVEAFAADPHACVRLGWQGVPASPVLFPRRLFGALLALEGADGGRSVLADEDRVELVEAAEPEELWDVDAPDDVSRVEAALEARKDKTAGSGEAVPAE